MSDALGSQPTASITLDTEFPVHQKIDDVTGVASQPVRMAAGAAKDPTGNPTSLLEPEHRVICGIRHTKTGIAKHHRVQFQQPKYERESEKAYLLVY